MTPWSALYSLNECPSCVWMLMVPFTLLFSSLFVFLSFKTFTCLERFLIEKHVQLLSFCAHSTPVFFVAQSKAEFWWQFRSLNEPKQLIYVLQLQTSTWRSISCIGCQQQSYCDGYLWLPTFTLYEEANGVCLSECWMSLTWTLTSITHKQNCAPLHYL